MSTHLHTFLLILSLPCAIHAQGNPPATEGQVQKPVVEESMQPSSDMAALEHFLRMSNDQLAAMAAAIDRVRNMSPQERRQLERQIVAYSKLSSSQREQIRSGWASEKDWADWRDMIQSLSEKERTAIQTTLQTMPFEERAAHKHQILEDWRAEQETNN